MNIDSSFSSSSSSIKLITTLAMYQTEFWAQVGLCLKRQGQDVAFLSFDDRSTELLTSLGFLTFTPTKEELSQDTGEQAFSTMLAQYDIQDTNYWFSHERFTFGISDSSELRRKLMAYLALADRACANLRASGKAVTMVQELGGFISVIASFFAARKNGIDNWFIEPSFFRGRLFFLKNSFSALAINLEKNIVPSAEVQDYLRKTLDAGTIVVPKKDSHQYTTAMRKIVNGRNIRRLVEKVIDKHLRGKHQEFGYIGRHVAVHAKMLMNSVRLRKRYVPLQSIERFVYYPLHVPGDMALTLRSPQYLDQLALIEYLARTVPHTHKVVIKEHPAMIGAIDASRIIELLGRYDNIVLLPPSTNNYEVLRSADVIVSVNSKSGAEAALLGKPVLVLGDAFYRNSPLVEAVESLTQLPAKMNDALTKRGQPASRSSIEQYFEAVWRESYPGELYISQEENVRIFTASLLEAIESNVNNGPVLHQGAG